MMENRYLSRRPLVLGLAKALALMLGQSSLVQAIPITASTLLLAAKKDKEGESAAGPNLWLYLSVAAALVLLGGAFAGLTIALMGQDEMYLEVIRQSGEGSEKRHAESVLRLLRRGKHWVLVTLLLSNVITNETLPIVLDRSLGGGWPAVLGSTVLIVIFGEIAPQSVCVRYGLPIGAWMSPFVLILMYILAPVAWPTAKLLDYLLGEEHGTVYKKAGLKTLVSLHKSMGEVGQQLNTDEVTIISAVLDLKDKSIGSIMTPMDDVFTLSLDDVLDEPTMDDILSQGYSRIPVHHPDNDENFVGMLLVKMLITYDPEDAKPVRDFALATLPETRPDTSCLDIINFFQEGKSHMIMVSDYPGEDHGSIGVVTLEDVIEELIGEEIVDESDVFVDVHRAIRRTMPAPRARIAKGQFTAEPPSVAAANGDLIDIEEHQALSPGDIPRSKPSEATARKQSPVGPTTRRRSSATNSNLPDAKLPKQRTNTDDIKEHLKHLGPSNLASRPKTTRYNTVKIKPGGEPQQLKPTEGSRIELVRRFSETASEYTGGIGEGLIPSGGKVASDGVQALQVGYGTTTSTSPNGKRPTSAHKAVQARPDDLEVPEIRADDMTNSEGKTRPPARTSDSQSTVGSLPERTSRSKSPYYQSRGPARSGSITENIIDTNGIRKVVLETTSSSESNEEEDNSGTNKGRNRSASQNSSSRNGANTTSLRGGGSENKNEDEEGTKKQKRRRKRKTGNGAGEREPLLGDRS